MKTEYSFPGGKVVRISAKKWDVFAPDGRFLERFSTLRQASRKADHWDKWDALTSLATMIPFSASIIAGSIVSGEHIDEEKMRGAFALDVILFMLLRLPVEERGKVLAALEEKR